jgi:hypothetical protein
MLSRLRIGLSVATITFTAFNFRLGVLAAVYGEGSAYVIL